MPLLKLLDSLPSGESITGIWASLFARKRHPGGQAAASSFGDNGSMWICFNDGFVSVVADKNNPDRLLVRARRKQDLLSVCGNDVEALKDAGTDYRWRTFVDRKAFSALVAARIDGIQYTNFKNSVKDHDLHEMYMDFGPGTIATRRRTGMARSLEIGDTPSQIGIGVSREQNQD